MRTKIATVHLVLIAFLCGGAALAQAGNRNLANLARVALQGGATGAVAALRQAGPAGMNALLAACPDGDCRGAQDVLDRVCGVRDCADIRLFWYTDLEAAKAAARAAGKPILSLRLLGRLDEESSDADSRFFRTVFYKNREINQILRDRYILHWRSVRPVPRATIDFGDGTHLERTLAGNSIHYILDSRGRLLEPLPGLYGPATFQGALEEAARAETRTAAHLDDEQFMSWMVARRDSELTLDSEAFERDLKAAYPELAQAAADPTAHGYVPWTVLQFQATLRALTGGTYLQGNNGQGNNGSQDNSEGPVLDEPMAVNDYQLHRLAELRRPRIHLDPASRASLLREHGVTDPREAERLVDTLEATVALDEVIHQYLAGPAILEALSDPKVRKGFELEAFNDWVYKKVFTPSLSDPRLGLGTANVYHTLPASFRPRTASKSGC
jgi:hypothetical protein